MSEADDVALTAAVTAAESPGLPPDSPAEDVAPKRRRATRAPRVKVERPPRSRVAAPKLAPRIEAAHEMIGGALVVGQMLGRIPVAGGAFGAELAKDAAKFGEAWEAYAKANPRVRDALERLLAVSELGVLLSLYARAGFIAYQAGADGAGPDLSAFVPDDASGLSDAA